MQRIRRSATASLVTVGLMGLSHVSAPSYADDGADEHSKQHRMQLVLDSSGSMKEPSETGTKIQSAKKALDTVIDDLPGEAEVGMRVYGATINKGKGACTDSQQVVEPGTDNRADLHTAIDEYKPLGETPIGYALEQAADDLGSEGKRTIVLVSDGESTCKPDPCQVARKLSKDGIDLRIDVVGLSVDAKTRKQLTCIAEAGNGTYYDADDAESLTRSIDTVSTRAFRPFDLTGERVTGGSQPAKAPTLEAGVQYLDKLPVPGATQFYRIDRTTAGSTIHVGTTARTSAGSLGDSVNMTLRPENTDDSCATGTSYGNGVGGDKALLAASVSTTRPSSEEECAAAKYYTLSVELGAGDELARTPFEIVVYEEPPLADGAENELPPAAEEPTWTPMKPHDAQSGIAPGTSLANAPVLDDGSYALDIQTSETQVFAVPLDWGRRLQVQIDSDLPKSAYDNAGAWSGFDVKTYGPIRGEADADMFGDEPPSWTTTAFGNMWIEDDKHWRTGAMTPSVRYLNRLSSDAGTAATALPGFRYVEVNLSLIENGITVPYELTVKRFGDAGEGTPEYKTSDDAPAPESDSAITAIGESVEPGGAAGGGGANDTENAAKSEEEAGSQKSGEEFPMAAAVLGGFGVLIIAGGIAAVVLARRPRTR